MPRATPIATENKEVKKTVTRVAVTTASSFSSEGSYRFASSDSPSLTAGKVPIKRALLKLTPDFAARASSRAPLEVPGLETPMDLELEKETVPLSFGTFSTFPPASLLLENETARSGSYSVESVIKSVATLGGATLEATPIILLLLKVTSISSEETPLNRCIRYTPITDFNILFRPV